MEAGNYYNEVILGLYRDNGKIKWNLLYWGILTTGIIGIIVQHLILRIANFEWRA